MGFGLKYLILGEDGENEEEEVEERLEKRKSKNLFFVVTFIAFASCGADNISLFTPYFVSLKLSWLPISILTFLIHIVFLGFLGKSLSRAKVLHQFLEKYSRWIMAVTYIGLGLFIFIEAGTLMKIINLLAHFLVK
ncbi:MAG: CadD family cadmium resistance transporter [Streptococcaceae bacterium]|nr:CadD family cadmium resistance transporter [Streptococcaceae bacterium]